jgi:mannose-6-phosphate isomerase-like protein (cupin superfamily)
LAKPVDAFGDGESGFLQGETFQQTSGNGRPAFIMAAMPTLISQPTRITSAGNKPTLIDEYIGRVNSKDSAVSVAHMRSPQGWVEPGQKPEFDEFTIVLRGMLRVKSEAGELDVSAGQAVVTHAGEWVQYSTPDAEGAEYVAVCLPAFSMDTVHRDE